MKITKPFSVKRQTKQEARFHPKMGALSTNVTRIQRTIFGFPVRTLHKYRETYFGEIKDCKECKVSAV